MDGPSNLAMRAAAGDGVENSAQPSHWGAFELRELVGRGGFGEVYRAWDPSLQREVGLKILLPRPYHTEAPYNEVLREARALAAVRHPNILPVYGVDRQDGRVGFWTDFVRGKTLAALVREQGPFGYREAALMGLDVCRALSAVHRAGLLHRDIKAENAMREEGGRILLMDFGLSTLDGNRSDFAGTARYMAPELLRGESASVASDIYAAGVLLFFLVTGRYPREPENSGSLPHTLTTEDWKVDLPTDAETALSASVPASAAAAVRRPVALSVLDHRPDLPDGFVRIIETAMRPDPGQRFLSAGAMSSALAESLGTSAAESGQAVSPPKKKPRRVAWATGLTLAVVLIALGAIYLARGGRLPGLHRQTALENVPASLNDEFLKADGLLERYDIHKNVTDAIDLLNKILAQDPKFALARADLGRAYFLEYRVTHAPGLLNDARTACNQATAADGSLARPYATLASIDAATGHTDLATQDVNEALSLEPRSAEAHGAQAAVYYAEGRTGEAIAAVQQAAVMDPEYWGWPVVLGNYYYSEGKLGDAQNAYRQAESIVQDSPSPIVLLNLGLVALQLEQYSEAEADLEKSALIQPSFAAYSALSEVYSSQGKYPQAVEAGEKALGFDRTDYLAWGNLASNYLWIPSDRAKAIDTYRKAIQLAEAARKETPDDPQLLAELGDYYASIGQADRSLPLLGQAAVLAPEDPSVLFVTGDGYEILHHRAEAIPLIVRSLALGFHADQLQHSPELASLRADPKFQQALRTALAQHR
ncbi:MAG: protein kinase domain-containing protein [Terracidiphilus sp.]